MRAQLLMTTAPIERNPLALTDVPVPKPERGQVLVRVTACGVCRSNLHMIEGDWLDGGVPAKLPIVPGHEVAGRVEQLGEGVEGFQPGDRVGIQPLWETCMRCEFCITGRENLCRSRLITGEHVDGGYAEYVVAVADHLYHIPDAIDDVHAAPLFCPGITAYHAVEKARLRPGQSAALFGMGGVGHMIVQFAKLAGAHVITVARGKRHREVAESLGSDRTIDASTQDAGAILQSEGGVDAAFVFAPSAAMFEQAINAVKPGGIVVNGAATASVELPFEAEKEIVGSVIGPRRHMQQVLELAAAGKIKVLAREFSLEQAPEALAELKRGEIEARAVIVV